MVSRNVRDFAQKTLTQALATVRCGFELETLKTDGYLNSSRVDQQMDVVDEEATSDRRYQWIIGARKKREYWAPALTDEEKARLTPKRQILVNAYNAGEISGEAFDRCEEHLSRMATESVAPVMRRGTVSALQHFADTAPERVEVVLDGSVSGFEFRTVGGLTAKEFKNASDAVFDGYDHQIDYRCSFHIHVSVPGIEHKYSDRMLAAMTEFLVVHARDRVPKDVLYRWKQASSRGRYFAVCFDDRESTKYRFIHKHQQGTWEFRCFGNIKKTADAWKCLKLAVAALQYAYRVALGEKQMIYANKLSRGEWLQWINYQLDYGTSPRTARKDLAISFAEAA